MEQKPFEATPSRVERARREGDVARSVELCGIAAFAGALVTLAAIVPALSAALEAALKSALSGNVAPVLAEIAMLCALPMLAAAACGCACAFLQTGGLHAVPITIKFERLSPAQNVRRMASRETVVTAVRATAAFACTAGVAVLSARAAFAVAARGSRIAEEAAAGWSAALHAAEAACAIAAFFGIADYAIAHGRWRARLRMSYEEFKRDRKDHDGDPAARGRRQALHRRFARESISKVKQATFVIVNPTHIAVALQYNPPKVAVPRVLLCAADETALRVRKLAARYAVPVIENVQLARTLFALVRPGDVIPYETYLAVAEIVAAL